MKEDKEVIFLDTNILIYAFDVDAGLKHDLASDLLEDCWNKKIQLAISSQTISEFFVNIIRKIKDPLEAQKAKEVIRDIISFDAVSVFGLSSNTNVSAMQIYSENQGDYWDCLIAATMKENNIVNIYTENEKDFEKIEGIKVINPLK